jgi:hypothetical protein
MAPARCARERGDLIACRYHVREARSLTRALRDVLAVLRPGRCSVQ